MIKYPALEKDHDADYTAGGGLVILLAGEPGVGKTLTAESGKKI